jgi:hypothetical protein
MRTTGNIIFPLAILAAAGMLRPAAPVGGATPSFRLVAKPAIRQTFNAYVDGRLATVLAGLTQSGNFRRARHQLAALFDLAIGYSSRHDTRILRRVDLARRLIRQLTCVPGRQRRLALLTFLQHHRELESTLVFLISPGSPPARIYALLDRLHRRLGTSILQYPNLTAAICTVLYQPLTRHINANVVHSPDPVALFQYFVRHRRKLLYGLRRLPARLLVRVVDPLVSTRDLRWALAHFHGDRWVGQLFFRIPYDYAEVRHGPTKVRAGRYTLRYIFHHGGICGDQAFFASEVGKAIGVPTAYVLGRSSVAGHAWVGFLQIAGRRGRWNFTARYPQYQGVAGLTESPRTRRIEPESMVSLSARFIGTPQHQRWTSAVLTDAALRLIALKIGGVPFAPPPPPAGVFACRDRARTNTVVEELGWLRRAVKICPGRTLAWLTVGFLARQGRLTLAEKEIWSRRLLRLCGGRAADFALAVLTPMVQSIPDPVQQNRIWNRLFARLAAQRLDLAAQVRMDQAAMWRQAGHDNRAGRCYLDVINHYANAGPIVISALRQAAALLRAQHQAAHILPLYEQTWAKIRPPPRLANPFLRQSNWYRVGSLLRKQLRAVGRSRQADQVQAQLRAAAYTTAPRADDSQR